MNETYRFIILWKVKFAVAVDLFQYRNMFSFTWHGFFYHLVTISNSRDHRRSFSTNCFSRYIFLHIPAELVY